MAFHGWNPNRLHLFFRWDVGLYVSASIFATISLFYALHISQKAEPTAKITFKLSQIIILAGTALIIILISYGYVGFKSGFENLWEQVVIFPSTTLRNIRSLPYPALLPSKSELLNWLRFYFPLFIYGTAFALYCYNILKKGVIFNTQNFGSIVTAILGLLLFTQAISRYDYIHVIPTSLVAIITAFSLLSQKAFSSANLIIKSARIVMLTFLIVLYIVLPSIMLLNSYTAFSPLKCYSQVEKANCIYLEKDQEQAVEYIREHTVGSDYIFVGNQQHDRIFINDIGFYFLSARQSPSKYSELYPGVATTLPIQQSIIQDIQSHNVEWIVLVNIPESTEPNGSADSSGVTILDDFIQSNYLQVKEFGNYQIWKMATR